MSCDAFVGVKQPLYAFKKLLREAVLPLSTSQSVVSVRSLQLESVMCSIHGTPDCTSSYCWHTPKFEIGSPSCSITPCSTQCRNTPNAADDVTSAVSPCGSASCSSSSSSSSSSAASSGDQLQTSLTEAERELTLDASVNVSLSDCVCHVTSANDTAHQSHRLPQSMQCAAQRSYPTDTELLQPHSPS